MMEEDLIGNSKISQEIVKGSETLSIWTLSIFTDTYTHVKLEKDLRQIFGDKKILKSKIQINVGRLRVHGCYSMF